MTLFHTELKVSEEQYNRVMELVESGKKEGALVTCGGNKWGSEGYFVEPTVFANVTDEMRIAKEEVSNGIMSRHNPPSEMYCLNFVDFWPSSNYF